MSLFMDVYNMCLFVIIISLIMLRLIIIIKKRVFSQSRKLMKQPPRCATNKSLEWGSMILVSLRSWAISICFELIQVMVSSLTYYTLELPFV